MSDLVSNRVFTSKSPQIALFFFLSNLRIQTTNDTQHQRQVKFDRCKNSRNDKRSIKAVPAANVVSGEFALLRQAKDDVTFHFCCQREENGFHVFCVRRGGVRLGCPPKTSNGIQRRHENKPRQLTTQVISKSFSGLYEAAAATAMKTAMAIIFVVVWFGTGAIETRRRLGSFISSILALFLLANPGSICKSILLWTQQIQYLLLLDSAESTIDRQHILESHVLQRRCSERAAISTFAINDNRALYVCTYIFNSTFGQIPRLSNNNLYLWRVCEYSFRVHLLKYAMHRSSDHCRTRPSRVRRPAARSGSTSARQQPQRD